MRTNCWALLLLAAMGVGVTASAETVEAVAAGLSNPRGIAIGPAHRVYVAEAGTGVAGSGRISSWWRGRAEVVLDGLESVNSIEGPVAGPVGIGLKGLGQLYFTYGGGAAAGSSMGTLQRGLPKLHSVADIRAYDAAHPEPIADPPTDANPYAIAVLDQGVLVADAAANNLKYVTSTGAIHVVARLPLQVVPVPALPFPTPAAMPAQPVPSAVAVGPDGWWYVGELKGFPFPIGHSRIWKIRPGTTGVTCDPEAGADAPCQLVADDLTAIVGIAFGADGSLYVSQMARDGLARLLIFGNDPATIEGALVRIRPDGVRVELAAGLLSVPGGVAVAGDGVVYVVNGSVLPHDGEVVRIVQ